MIRSLYTTPRSKLPLYAATLYLHTLAIDRESLVLNRRANRNMTLRFKLHEEIGSTFPLSSWVSLVQGAMGTRLFFTTHRPIDEEVRDADLLGGKDLTC